MLKQHIVLSCENYYHILYLQEYPLDTCILRSISADEISCRWSNITATMSGVVLVTVNNAMVQNNSVTYQYLNNPVYTGLTPLQTIRA